MNERTRLAVKRAFLFPLFNHVATAIEAQIVRTKNARTYIITQSRSYGVWYLLENQCSVKI